MSLLEVKNLVIAFKTDRGMVTAVNDISFTLEQGESVAIVGESGCGKTVTSLAILGLIPGSGRIVSGDIILDGKSISKYSESELRKIRGQEVSMIFQEPMTALNPVFTVGTQMIDVLRTHTKLTRKQAKHKAIELLATVNIPVPERRLKEYPHQLSGGMRQRVMIGMALSCGPKILIADEPTTALDVTTQAQVMLEITRLQKELGMAMILVTHDLGIVSESAQDVMVMYCGRMVEKATVNELFAAPKHPYTRGLLASVPRIRTEKLSRLPTIEGAVPDLHHLPPGCAFADRCSRVQEPCRTTVPQLTNGDHAAACFFPYS